MKILFLFAFLLSSGLFSQSLEKRDKIHYASLNYATRSGQYDGVTTIGELKKWGNFGLGSTEKVESELVIIDGIFYGIPKSGRATVLDENTKIAFSAITFFSPEQSFRIQKKLKLSELEKLLDSALVKNAYAAIKMTGTLSSVVYSFYYPQTKPYKPIDKVKLEKFEKESIEGTLVGFFTPEASKEINSPVYHFHFIDKGRTTGGHLQQVELKDVNIEIDYAEELSIQLPDPKLMEHIDLNKDI